MYFDFEDYRPETPSIEGAISRREGVLLSIAIHALAFGLFLAAPHIPFIRALQEQAQEVALQHQAELERNREQPRFVFVQPRVELPARQPPPRAELSDQDRAARSLERRPAPQNPLPYARGNTRDRVEAEIGQTARAPAAGQEQNVPPAPQAGPSVPAAPSDNGAFAYQQPQPEQPRAGQGSGSLRGAISEALNNLQRYTRYESFDNPTGGTGAFGPSIQFDTKGVEFGPWIRRFIAQIKRNWFVPYAAMSFHGHVVLTFNVHKDGRITDLQVVKPSDVEAFTSSAHNALFSSNPTYPLPTEYPADQAFFTVTFYYNENPPSY